MVLDRNVPLITIHTRACITPFDDCVLQISVSLRRIHYYAYLPTLHCVSQPFPVHEMAAGLNYMLNAHLRLACNFLYYDQHLKQIYYIMLYTSLAEEQLLLAK